MSDILHRVGIKSSPDATYEALATREGLAGWWANDTQGESKVGGVLRFRFGAGGFDIKVLELQPAKRVLWQVVDGPEEWIGTKVSWDLRQEGDYTVSGDAGPVAPCCGVSAWGGGGAANPPGGGGRGCD